MRALIVDKLLQGRVDQASMLDAGCGDGTISLQFIQQLDQLTLVDISENMLEVARGQVPAVYAHKVTYHQADFLNWEPDTQYDLVFCIGVLAWVESLENAILQLTKLVKTGGYVVIQFTDNRQVLGRAQYALNRARHRFKGTVTTLNSLNREAVIRLSQSHFTLVEQVTYSLLPPGLGFLPDNWLFRLDLVTLRYPGIGQFGSERLMLLHKP